MSRDYKGDDAERNGEDSNVSRRNMILLIGQAAIGFELSSSAPAHTKEPVQLAPGLYQPSTDGLGHALMSAGRFHPIPPGCPTDYIRPRTGAFAPSFFSPAEFAVVRHLTGLMLGETSTNAGNADATPGQEVAEWVDLRVATAASVRDAARQLDSLHRILAVAYFGSAHVTQLETAYPEKICREGLEWLAGTARARGADQFLSLAEEQQIAILNAVSDERTDKQSENSGTRFFAFLKAEVIRGYYTSQVGLKEVDFKGNSFYAGSPGCSVRAKG